MLTRFDCLDNKLLHIKDVIIKELRIENQRLQSKIIVRRKLVLLEKTETCWNNVVDKII